MACIDKIYMTREQYLRVRKWYELMMSAGEMSERIPLNQYDHNINDWPDNEQRPVWNLSVEGDMWLLSNCPFDFVKDRIMFIYNLREEVMSDDR